MVKDNVDRQKKTPATGTFAGSQSVKDHNVWVEGVLYIPSSEEDSFNGGVPRDGAIKLTNGKLKVYYNGVWSEVTGNGNGTGQPYGFEYIDDEEGVINIEDSVTYKHIATGNVKVNALDTQPGMSGVLIIKQDDLGGHRITLDTGNNGAAIIINTNPRAETRLSWERYDDAVYWKNEIITTGLLATTLPIFAINDYYNTLDIFHQLGYTEIEISTNNGPWVQFIGPITIGAVDRPRGYWRARIKANEPTRLVSGISYSNPVFAAQFGFNYTLNLKLS